jgi:cation transport protein ChaC
MADMGDFWVFGYGSLMWNPGFDHVETVRARVSGYRRSLCLASRVHRGTPEREGLVLALDRGGSCVGVAFRVEQGKQQDVVAYLRERELVTNAYLERYVSFSLPDGRKGRAITYVIDRNHDQYAGALSEAEAARRVMGASGKSGPNEDYVLNTIEHLRALGIRDHWLEAVGRIIRAA